MTPHLRSVARLGAALLAAAGLVLPAAPAHAEDPVVDVGVDVVGTRLAAGTTDKIAVVKVSNHGTFTPDLIAIDYSAKDFDYSKVRFDPLLEGCDVDGDEKNDDWNCPLRGEQIPGPGETVELPLLVFKTTDQLTEPYRTTLHVSVTPWNEGKTLTDANPADNGDDYEVELTTESGGDLTVVAPDITQEVDPDGLRDGNPKPAPLNPGDRTVALAYVRNQGDYNFLTLSSLRMTLPKGVTFEERDGDCNTSKDLQTMTCLIEPALESRQWVEIGFPVRVAPGVDAPTTLSGGTVTVSGANPSRPTDETRADRGTTLPPFMRKVSGVPRAVSQQDIDESDNSDDFAVVVTPAAANGGGGGGGGGGQDGGLPVTGPQAGLLGAVGAFVLAAGTVLFLTARRRRVVLVTPGDEKPAD